MTLYSIPEYQEDLEIAFQSVPGIDQLNGKKILVTGARGLIGSFIVELLLYCLDKKGFNCQIYGTGRDINRLKERFKGWENRRGLNFLSYELGKKVSLCDFPASVDYIIHCAGSGSPSEFMKRPSEFVRDTVSGAYEILEYARFSGACKCLLLSSGEAYGQGETPSFTEEYRGDIDNLSIRSCYPVAKRAAETLWLSFGNEHHLGTIIARVSHTYGPTALPDESRIAGICLKSALHGEKLVLRSEGKQRRSWCYVADCASGLMTVLLQGEAGQMYNVASKEAFTIAEMAEITASIAGKRVEYVLPSDVEEQNFNPMETAVLSSEKLEKSGWRSCYSLYDGLERTLNILKNIEGSPDE